MIKTPEAYLEYLESDHWKNLRGLVLERDGNKCRRCSSTFNLQAHHKFYREKWEDSQIGDLITLCHDCHKREHDLHLNPRLNEIGIKVMDGVKLSRDEIVFLEKTYDSSDPNEVRRARRLVSMDLDKFPPDLHPKPPQLLRRDAIPKRSAKWLKKQSKKWRNYSRLFQRGRL